MVHFTTDVLIAGAGPAGLITAIGLARRGVDFMIVDALPAAQNTSRAAVIHAATLEALEALDIAAPLIAKGIEVPHFHVRDRNVSLLHADFSALDSEIRFALMIPQDETERLLIDHLESLGHTIRRPTEVRSVRHSTHGMIASCEERGVSIEIAAKYVVGADGENSLVRRAASIAFPGKLYGSFLLADAEMEWPLPRDEVTLFFSEQGTLVVAPMSRDRFRIVAQLESAPKDPEISDVQAVLDKRGPGSGAQVSKLLWGSRFQVHHKLADTFHRERIVLVGDAAHVHSPAGGQGMNLGIRDAIALSEAMAHSLQGGGDGPLTSYARSRREKAMKVLRMTDRLTQVATLGTPRTRCFRNRLIAFVARFPVVRRAIARRLAGYN